MGTAIVMKVHLFPTVDELNEGFRIPFQYLGTSIPPAARAIPDTLLIDWIISQLQLQTPVQTVADGGTVTVAAGLLITHIAIKAASGDRVVKIGTTPGGDDIMEGADVMDGQDFTASIGRYSTSSLTLHFSISGGSAQVLVYTKS